MFQKNEMNIMKEDKDLVKVLFIWNKVNKNFCTGKNGLKWMCLNNE